MTHLSITDAVCTAFPHLRSTRSSPRVIQAVSRGLRSPSGSAASKPAAAGQYCRRRTLRTSPPGMRPAARSARIRSGSARVLRAAQRLERSARLPRINAAVDCYNLVSVTTGVPTGAFDMRQVKSIITMRLTTGGEEFTPLSEPRTTEHPRPGEVIYADAEDVLTRHWNNRDAERTKVTGDSGDLVFLLETVDAPAFGAALDAATASLTALLRSGAKSVNVRRLTPAHPACALLARDQDS